MPIELQGASKRDGGGAAGPKGPSAGAETEGPARGNAKWTLHQT